jgi:hypothetical protein
MAIDVHSEHLVPLDEYTRLRPPGRNGKLMHKSTGYRHAFKGYKGKKLDTVQWGGKTYTSKEAISRFIAALSEARTASTNRECKDTPGRETGTAAKEADHIFK